MKALKAGELAKQAQVNVETIRYYEREELLPEPERTESGYRIYQQSDVKRVHFIKRAQELGFTLKEIRELLALKINPKQSAGQIKELTQNKILLIAEKIELLQAMKKILEELSETCPGHQGTINHCPIIQCLDNQP